MFARVALTLLAGAGVAGCDSAGSAAKSRAEGIVRPTITAQGGAPVVMLGQQVVLTAARAEEAARFAIRAQADTPAAQIYLIDAPSGGSACPMRYVVLTVTAGRGVATPPFGTCSSRARLQAQGSKIVVTMPGFSNTGPAGPPVSFTLKGNEMVADKASEAAPALQPVAYTPSLRCSGTASQADADAMLAAFEREYPASLVSSAQVEGVKIPPATLDDIVASLSCLAAQPGGDPFVPEQAAALFASKRHGAAAFEAVERLASAGDEPARRFAEQMRAYTR